MYTGDQKVFVCVLQLQSSQTLNVKLNAGLIYETYFHFSFGNETRFTHIWISQSSFWPNLTVQGQCEKGCKCKCKSIDRDMGTLWHVKKPVFKSSEDGQVLGIVPIKACLAAWIMPHIKQRQYFTIGVKNWTCPQDPSSMIKRIFCLRTSNFCDLFCFSIEWAIWHMCG